MDDKVRRGLGLCVVAVIAGLVMLMAESGDRSDFETGVGVAMRLVVLTAGGAGLLLVAWGLLRPGRNI